MVCCSLFPSQFLRSAPCDASNFKNFNPQSSARRLRRFKLEEFLPPFLPPDRQFSAVFPLFAPFSFFILSFFILFFVSSKKSAIFAASYADIVAFVPLLSEDVHTFRSMAIQFLESVKSIEKQFSTGEEPVLVLCSDMNAYVCKYMRSSTSAYKLVCEFIGSQMADAWQLGNPEWALVQIRQDHWAGHTISHSISAPAIGSKWLNNVIDVTPSTLGVIEQKAAILRQLLMIALFDFWVANEDRNANNANLLYEIAGERLIPIDYGCIFNTATFDFPMSQLTSTDTILWSDLFQHLKKSVTAAALNKMIGSLNVSFLSYVVRCSRQVKSLLHNIPARWNVPQDTIKNKVQQLFDEAWITAVWNQFIECLNENLGYEQA